MLEKYKILFTKRISTNPVTGIETTRAIIDSTDIKTYIIARFFSDYHSQRDIQDYILNIVDEAIENPACERETGSESGIAVYVTSTITKFVDFHGSGTYLNPDLTLPTPDFRQISLEWKSFLQNINL